MITRPALRCECRKLGRYWLALTLVAAAFATSAALYPKLPAIMPTHWNAAGVIDGWMPKSRGVLVVPGVASVIVALLIGFEPIEIQEDARDLKIRHYPTIVAGVAGLNFFFNLRVLMAGMGWHLALTSNVAIGMGLLLVVLGDIGLIGMGAPWTLADDEARARTHRISGWLLVLAGGVMAATGYLGFGVAPGLLAVGAAAAASIAYSCLTWRRLSRGERREP